MRQVCPHCLAAVDVPAAAAGGDHECPVCRKRFAVPAAYAPAVDPAAVRAPALTPAPNPPPPTPDRPVPPPGFVPAGPHPAAPPSTYAAARGVTLGPRFIQWLPVACLTLAFLLTFFAWVVIAPNGIRSYTQTPWGSLFRGFTSDPVAEPVLEAEKVLFENLSSTWVFLLPYFLGLIVVVVVLWLERVAELTPSPALARLKTAIPNLALVLTGLAAILLFLVLVQSAKGFGLEAASEAAKHAEAAKLPGMKEKIDAADTTVKKQRVEVETAKATAYLTPDDTTARSIALWLHWFALAGLLGRVWLDRRGPKPPPQVELRW